MSSCILSALVFLSCSSPPPEEKEAVSLPDKIIEKFTYTESSGGEKLWQLFAQKALVYEEQTHLYGIKVHFYTQGNISSVLEARKGKIYPSSGDMEAEGEVRVESLQSRETLDARTLYWDAGRKKILGDDFIRWETSQTITTGYGLETDPGLKEVKIQRKVKTVVKE